MEERFFEENINVENGPVVATAIHDGNAVREDLQGLCHLTEQERMREEDPYTGELARQFDNYVIVSRSRFEVDLNRSPDKAIYRKPEDAWGMKVWKSPLKDEEVEKSLSFYHNFYRHVEEKLSEIIDAYGFVIVYDLHSYNHRREGPGGPVADAEGNPDIDILTANTDMDTWGTVLEKLKQSLRNYPYPNGPLDVREEVRFKGDQSHFMQWFLRRFKEKAFIPSIEFKKIFMNEWTGEVYTDKLEHLKKALKHTEDVVLEEVKASQKILSDL